MATPSNYSFSHFEPRVGRSVSLGQAAQTLQVSMRTIYYWIREGRLRTIRTLNGSQRVLLDSLEEAVARGRRPSTSISNAPSSDSAPVSLPADAAAAANVANIRRIV